ncbi:MAG: tRNA (N(6)-L-threonylcarbamoyladenosine(37)-C(2))-methylthiotransferase [Candidatus Bathyarchaeota archaeon]|nr:tRNA (N(6)-L-threonylcarbamoyladenosine(37)-C(2))-methylthiotransferase [Candidatus Bathyarchaeum tardum]WGM89339.1 MAG: tRNA (N(6)-L-threonylcarbamoyladenosine(37)-C(2))-methylthiotransferase [Candidatus Bathyarchaeum tardum]WNZ28386.1 MAG: tRNA (N(6)-L-threonylcarbamoyladenosine(37)-C(2))-methylthiotransferase [Candidatus Bathyarchaeota archaeon]
MGKESKMVYIKSFGCSANLADGEVIAGCLSEAGFRLVENIADADFVVYNTCAVKSPTENRIINMLKKVPKNKKLIVTGCLPVINFERIESEIKFDAITGPAPGEKIVDVLERVKSGEKVVSVDNNSESGLELPRVAVNPVVSVIPINYGCLGNCSYCCVHFARGQLRSNSVEGIVNRVNQDLCSGAKEFWLTSQDTACYGNDKKTNLANLLKKIGDIEGNFLVRVGMMNPDHVLGMLDELVEAYDCDKIFKFLHLPVQSGDDKVLGLMNRRYTVNEFQTVVETFRKKFPQLTLATDVICGFPGETKEAFENTKLLITKISPDVVNVSKFFARPHTPAEKMHPIAPEEVNRRSKQMSLLARHVSFDQNKNWKGWTGKVLINEKGKNDSWISRNFAYKPIVIKSVENMLGKFVQVKVVKAFSTYLEAEIT